MSFLDGKKNYIFGAVMIVCGAAEFFFPELEIKIFGIDDPSTMISAGIAWVLGRNALKKVEK